MNYSPILMFTIVIVFLSCASIIGAQDCSGHGLLQNSVCDCYSGFAPSDNTDVDCSVTVDPTCIWLNATTNTTVGSANLNSTNTNFEGNVLTLFIQSPIVVDRTTTSVSIGGSTDPNCVYPGVNFQKSLFSCTDAFIGQIPWSDNSVCNFKPDTTTDPTVVTYNAPVYITSTEVTNFRGHDITQTQTDVLHISVTFQKTIQVSGTVQVDAPVSFFTAILNQTFIPSTGLGFIAFATDLVWPYTLTLGTVEALPSGLTLSGSLNDITAAGDCTAVNGTDCFQQYSFELDPGSVCVLTGIYEIDFTMTCRGSAPCPIDTSSSNAKITLSLSSSDFCASLSTTVGASGTISTFQDEARTTPQTAFFVGNTGFFEVDVVSTQAELASTTITDISVTIGGTPTPLYTAGAIVNAALSEVASDDDTTASFAVDFTSTLFTVPQDGQLQYSFTVDVGVTFAGNRKREVFASSTTSSKTRATTSISLQNPASNNQHPSSDASSSRISYALTALTILLLCIF